MTLIDELHAEFDDRRQVLHVLRRELERLAEGERPDLETMQECLCFLTQYTDVIDHAKEVAIQQPLLRCDAGTRRLVRSIRAERGHLRQQATSLLDAVEDMLEDVVVPLDDLRARGEDYLARQTALFEREERELLPLATEKLKQSHLGTADRRLRQCRQSKLRALSRERFERLTGAAPATQL
jgi:hemerythrin-like domain-containing protein